MALKNPWEEVRTPLKAEGGTQVIGFYSLGCLVNAETAAISSAKWEAVNTFRNRYYAHPSMLEFLEYLGTETLNGFKKKIVIGDIGLPGGGPTTSGHASHQTGLDVDLRYRFYPAGKKMSDQERSKFAAPDIAIHKVETLAPKKYRLRSELVGSKLDSLVVKSLEKSALHSKVERIFVSPPIKKQLCAIFKKGDGPAASYPEWLVKISPYFGHSDHYHVRLACPADSPDCLKQDPVKVDPADATRVGCAGPLLDWWFKTSLEEDTFFRKEVRDIENPPPPDPPSWIGKVCLLPEKCKKLIPANLDHCPPASRSENPSVPNQNISE